MTIQIFYESGKDATYTDVTDRYISNTLDVAIGAEEGNVEQSVIEFDDPDGTLDIVGWRRVYIFETDAPALSQLIGGFWVGDVDVVRSGTASDFYVSASRVWKVGLLDQNAILHMRMMVKNAKRTAVESDVAFVQWLMTHPSMSRIINTDRLYTGSPVNMSPNRDYLGQKGVEALDDAAQDSGKNYYAYTKENGPNPFLLEPALWYGAYDLASVYDSDLRISNVLADVDTVDTFAMSHDTTLTRSVQRVYSGGYGQYDGGATYSERAATHVEFTRRDVSIPMANVKTLAAAKRRVARELGDIATAEDVITTSILVPPSAVNRAREGMRVQLKATHLPGYEDDYVWLRCLRRQVKEEDFLFRITMELAKPTPGSTDLLCSNLTATGSYYPLGGSGTVANTSPTGNVIYWRPGISYPGEVTPGHQGTWHFPTYGVGGSGTVDAAGDCSQNRVRCIVVGDGTIEVHTSTVDAGRNLVATLMHGDTGHPDTEVVDEVQEGQTGDTFTFTVSTHDGVRCTHWVDVTDKGDICGGPWGFSGFDWTAAS